MTTHGVGPILRDPSVIQVCPSFVPVGLRGAQTETTAEECPVRGSILLPAQVQTSGFILPETPLEQLSSWEGRVLRYALPCFLVRPRNGGGFFSQGPCLPASPRRHILNAAEGSLHRAAGRFQRRLQGLPKNTPMLLHVLRILVGT